MAANTVYLLSHSHEHWGRDESKILGVYSTRADAEAAVLRLSTQPGFRHWPDGFVIDPYELGIDHWAEGFSEVVPIHLRAAAEGDDTLECVHAEWMPGDRFKILEFESQRPLEFAAGQTVRCEERTIDGVDGCLVAVATAPYEP